MLEFKKATLQEVDPKPSNPPKTLGELIHVQINPATIRLQATATVSSGKDTGHQSTQHQGTTSTLSFDLVFDTSDEGTTDGPIDVRKRTAAIERFVWPAKKKPTPPRVQFTYGTLCVTGVMTSVSVDLDLFSTNGVPLRAKCAVQIKEQKAEFDLAIAGAGAKTASGATPPLQPGTPAQPASGAAPAPPPPTDRTGTALAGESASSFANRMGLDSRAWKGLQGVDDPLNLQAGRQIDFPSSLSADAGLGVQTGATAAPPVSQGLPPSPIPSAIALTGHDLTTAGGLSKAIDRIAADTAGSAAVAASSSFAGPPPAAPTGLAAAVSAAQGSASTVMFSEPDPRALSYGYGVPLRPRRAVVGPTTIGLVHEQRGDVAAGGEQPPVARDSTVPSWQALANDAGSAGGCCAVRVPCGCGGAR